METYYAFLRLLVAFPLVLILAYFGVRFFLKRYGPAFSLGRRVQVIERVALDSRTYLYVVKVGDEYLLLSSGQGGVMLLKELGTELPEEQPLEREGAGGDLSSFAGIMEQVKRRVPETLSGGSRSNGFLKGLKNRGKENEL